MYNIIRDDKWYLRCLFMLRSSCLENINIITSKIKPWTFRTNDSNWSTSSHSGFLDTRSSGHSYGSRTTCICYTYVGQFRRFQWISLSLPIRPCLNYYIYLHKRFQWVPFRIIMISSLNYSTYETQIQVAARSLLIAWHVRAWVGSVVCRK